MWVNAKATSEHQVVRDNLSLTRRVAKGWKRAGKEGKRITYIGGVFAALDCRYLAVDRAPLEFVLRSLNGLPPLIFQVRW